MLRYASKSLVLLPLAIGIGLICMWVRSYVCADRIHGCGSGRESFIVASKQGRVTLLWFTSHGHSDWWQWETRSYAVDDEMSFPVGSIRQYENLFGFGSITRPLYFVMPSTYETPQGTTVQLLGAATATLNGSGVIVPYWFLALVLAIVNVLWITKRPIQFSLRSFAVMITIVAVALGLVAMLEG